MFLLALRINDIPHCIYCLMHIACYIRNSRSLNVQKVIIGSLIMYNLFYQELISSKIHQYKISFLILL